MVTLKQHSSDEALKSTQQARRLTLEAWSCSGLSILLQSAFSRASQEALIAAKEAGGEVIAKKMEALPEAKDAWQRLWDRVSSCVPKLRNQAHATRFYAPTRSSRADPRRVQELAEDNGAHHHRARRLGAEQLQVQLILVSRSSTARAHLCSS